MRDINSLGTPAADAIRGLQSVLRRSSGSLSKEDVDAVTTAMDLLAELDTTALDLVMRINRVGELLQAPLDRQAGISGRQVREILEALRYVDD